MKTFTKISAILILISLVLSGCGLFGGSSANLKIDEQTQVAQTIVALQTSLAQSNQAAATVLAPTATPEQLPTFTPAATLPPPTQAYVPPAATSQPNYLITDVMDVTIPDGTTMQPGQTFTKTWRITNGGSATWTSQFKLVFVSGDQMGATAVALGRTVAPNQTIDVSVNLTAPTTNGTFQGNFMLQTNGGTNFGIGSGATSAFWVKIVVSKLFQVTNATVTTSMSSYSGTCPTTISLTANITSTTANSVTFHFVTSSGNSDTYVLSFSSAGTSAYGPISWPITASGTFTAHVYVDVPNHQDFADTSVSVTCTP